MKTAGRSRTPATDLSLTTLIFGMFLTLRFGSSGAGLGGAAVFRAVVRFFGAG